MFTTVIFENQNQEGQIEEPLQLTEAAYLTASSL